MSYEHDSLTETIIGCAYKVLNTLGVGFLEKVYENALACELKKTGVSVSQQCSLEVRYEGNVVGEFCADLIVEEKVIIELKAVKSLSEIHVAQCLNYLRATGLKTCLLLNFGTPKLGIKRLRF